MFNDDKSEEIITRIKSLPSEPGVYLWKDKNDAIIYVGKAKKLKNRMLQYFEGRLNSHKTNDLVKQINDFDIYITKSEKEALILEKRLIEKYSPIYNIQLLDDKRYPYIKISLAKKLSIKLDRKLIKDTENNTSYFGPFPHGFGAKQISQFLESELLYENGLLIDKKDNDFWFNQYQKAIEILSFKDKKIIDKINQKRLAAEDLLNYEQARDYLELSKYFLKLKETQQIELEKEKNIDVIDFIQKDNYLHITVLYYIYGVLINKDSWTFKIHSNVEDAISEFLNFLYNKKALPDQILLTDNLLTSEFISEFQNKIFFPKIGAKKAILEIAHKNNLVYIEQKKSKLNLRNIEAITQLAALLNIEKIQNIIAFDNSSMNNDAKLGVAIAYSNGQKNKSLYKKFDHSKYKEQLLFNSDDEFMYQNVLRYFKNNSFNVNDLVIIDGAISQLKKAIKALNELNIKINIISLVKDDKHKTSHILNSNFKKIEIVNKDLYNFLASVQIEVDRFAKEYLRNKRITSTFEGSIAKIPGIGSKYETKLLNHFKTYSGILNATHEQLCKVVPKNICEKIMKTLKNKN
ncbi:GIY-YIG nuclease family protein [Mycoplasmopsis alligatoris]|uniref:Excinuclease ABC, C subunit n=1 Tax=Mycoplasmopsis alligatoris A21JP2 TaxID=747682 RepID=D4XUV5_9BACT|nr:GIY-YIG nuclease family protein [Mycoplasmopsis alligatoris]EFF41869.1 excinuclease ABC, C subunit [Mycoplasmopsis alligatoris A21JP2]